jgi:hypothetical protein
MRRQELAQIRFSPQLAHDLGDRQLRKNPWACQRSANKEANTLISKAVYRPSPCNGIERIWKIDFIIFQQHSTTWCCFQMCQISAPRSETWLKFIQYKLRVVLFRKKKRTRVPKIGLSAQVRCDGTSIPHVGSANITPFFPVVASHL